MERPRAGEQPAREDTRARPSAEKPNLRLFCLAPRAVRPPCAARGARQNENHGARQNGTVKTVP